MYQETKLISHVTLYWIICQIGPHKIKVKTLTKQFTFNIHGYGSRKNNQDINSTL
jgi:hypothetical protein